MGKTPKFSDLRDFPPLLSNNKPYTYNDIQKSGHEWVIDIIGLGSFASSSLHSSAKPLFLDTKLFDSYEIPDIPGTTITTPDQLVGLLLEKYTQILGKSDRCLLFLSGGYDSRLELALLSRASEHTNTSITLVSFRDNPEETSAVQKLSKVSGYNLVLLDPAEHLEVGLSNKQLQMELLTYPKWRPTLPAYFAALDMLIIDKSSAAVFGYNPVSLKGRYWRGKAPGRVTVMDPPEFIVQRLGIKGNAVEQWSRQYVQQELARLIQDYSLTREQAQDALYFFLVHGRGYMDRIRVLSKFFWMASPLSELDVLSFFLRLPREAKIGSKFIEDAIESLAPRLLEVDFVSSSSKSKRQFFGYTDFVATSPAIMTALAPLQNKREIISIQQLSNYLDNFTNKDTLSAWKAIKERLELT